MIQVLPESVANQIAAGEVIQRPASVVKELVENAIDAGATAVSIITKDAGRTLIQVIDNGRGMSETDARLCFERHATSKISSADDLFAIQTFGFRGEALASIASIAEVELKTRRAADEVGTHISIYASAVVASNPIACPEGSAFSVRNLFYNVPARRKFLKTDAVELKHIITEFQRVALGYPEVAFTLVHNGTEIYRLAKGNLRQRIVGIFGKNAGNQLIDVSVNTSVARIQGFIGKPEHAKKAQGEQFFYVNNRFFKSAYFQKSVFNAYAQLIPQGAFPSFFLYFDVEPGTIDVNIHPTKVEVKFEEEQTIWQVLNAAVRESIGKFALSPTIDFDTEDSIHIPSMRSNVDVSMPRIDIDDSYNPFEEEKRVGGHSGSFTKEHVPQGWQSLYEGLDSFVSGVEPQQEEEIEPLFTEEKIYADRTFMQLKGEYILTPVKSGLMVIDQRRAHRRILFEELMQRFSGAEEISQTELFPEHIELNPSDYLLLENVLEDLQTLGFDIRSMGKNSVVVYALPVDMGMNEPMWVVRQLVDDIRENGRLSADTRQERMALMLARASGIGPNRTLTVTEMSEMVDKLFACQIPNLCPEGRPTFSTICIDEIGKRLLK